MKRHIFSMAAAAMVALAFVGCEDLVKDDIDAKYTHDVNLPAPECTDVTFETVTVSYEIDGDTAGLPQMYCGILFATKADFSDKQEFVVKPGEMKTLNVSGSTEYYAKSYIVVGTEVKYSEVSNFTTPAPPEFKDKYLFGSYLAYDDGVDDPEAMYPMEISWVENTYNRINLINWWGGEQTVTATVDFENKQIIVDFEPAIADMSIYGLGWAYFYSVDEGGNPTNDPIVGYYDANGNISFPAYYIYIDDYGEYGVGSTDMIKQ